MGIFDSFFGIDRDYKMPEIPTTNVDAGQQKAEDENYQRSLPAYQVGRTQDNRVTLRLGSEFTSTLTMTNEGVDTLIRMLEAAKDTYVQGATIQSEIEDKE